MFSNCKYAFRSVCSALENGLISKWRIVLFHINNRNNNSFRLKNNINTFSSNVTTAIVPFDNITNLFKGNNHLIDELIETMKSDNNQVRLLNLFDVIRVNIDNFDNEDLLRLLQTNLQIEGVLSRNDRLKESIINLTYALHNTYASRYLSLDVDTRLKLALALANIPIRIKSDFFNKVLRSFCRKFDKLNKNHCLACLELIRNYRWYCSRYVNLYLIERKLSRCFDDFDENEVGRFLFLFTKRPEYVFVDENLIKKLINFLSTTNSRSDTVIYLLDTFINNWRLIDRQSFIDIRRIITNNNNNTDGYGDDIYKSVLSINLYRKLNHYDRDALNGLILNYKRQMKTINYVHMRKVMEILTFYNVDDDNLYRSTLQELRSDSRTVDGSRYPKRLLQIVAYISSVNCYDYEIVNQALSSDYLRAIFDKRITRHSIPWYVFALNSNVSLDCPDYDGCKLSDDLVECWAQNVRLKNIRNNRHNLYVAVLLEVERYLRRYLFDINIDDEIFKTDEFTRVCYILPHLQLPDLVFALNNQTKMPQPLVFDDDIRWVLRPRKINSSNNSNSNYYVITFVNADNVPLCGHNVIKKRQLPKLGYEMIVLCSITTWRASNDSQKLELLKNKLNEIR